MEHLAVWTYSPGFIPSCSDSTTSKHAEPREQFTVMVDPENQLASLISAMFILRLVSVRVPSSSLLHFGNDFTDLITPLAEFWRWSLWSEMQLCYPDAQNSHGMYDVRLGLHPHLRNGSRSHLEIKVELHEGAVPLPTLLAFYRYHLVCYHWLVRSLCGYRSSYAQFFFL